MSNTAQRHGNKREADTMGEDDDDVVMVKNVVKVVESDFWPHPRKDCAFFPFFTTPSRLNVRCCGKCYCFMCDAPAHECEEWGETGEFPLSHCHAWLTATWQEKRELKRQGNAPRHIASARPHRNDLDAPLDSIVGQAGMQENPTICAPEPTMEHFWGSTFYPGVQYDGHYGWQWPGGYYAPYPHAHQQYTPQHWPLPPHLQDPPWRSGWESMPPHLRQVPPWEKEHEPPPPVSALPSQRAEQFERGPEGGGAIVGEGQSGELAGSMRGQEDVVRPTNGGERSERIAGTRHAPAKKHERDDPANNTRLAHWGTLSLECKVKGDSMTMNNLLRFGPKGRTTQADIVEFCRRKKLVSLWNLKEHLEFKAIMDPRRKVETVLADGVDRLLGEMVAHCSVPKGAGSQQPAMFTALRWIKGNSDVEGTLEFKVYIWRIGESLCLLRESSSTKSINRLLLYFCSNGKSDADHVAAHMLRRIHQWTTTVPGQDQEVSKELMEKAVRAMTYDIRNPYPDCVPPKQIKGALRRHQMHGIKRMKKAEEKELGFAGNWWVQLTLDGTSYWYSPFMKRICNHSPRRQCAGGFLSEDNWRSMMLMALGLVVEHTHSKAMVSCSMGTNPSQATLVVCPDHQVEEWIQVGEQIDPPFEMFEYELLAEGAPRMVCRCNVVLVRYSTLCREFLALGSEGSVLYSTLWRRIVFSYGEIFWRDMPIVEACQRVQGHFRWILSKDPISSNLTELLHKFRALNLEPWYDKMEFQHLTKCAWMPMYLMSRLVIKHANLAE